MLCSIDSVLKLVKNYLRSTMSPDRLVDLAKLEHYFTIAFSGAFLVFFSPKRVMTLSKLIFLAISDSMLSLAKFTKRSCDMVERK